jgi:hypothetical protein
MQPADVSWLLRSLTVPIESMRKEVGILYVINNVLTIRLAADVITVEGVCSERQ